ncbi:MAG: Tad domain-containing protein, partial [Acidimicrobiia bacterium]
MRRLIRDFKTEQGAALPILALMMVTLVGLAGFGTDLAWFYLNASRVQRAADAGALAGVIQMPDDFTQAEIDAKSTTKANNYEDGVDNATIGVAVVPTNPNQLDVTVRDVVPTFFAKIFGMSDVTIARTARAEYVPPLRLGSPTGIMGNDPTCFA